MIKVKWINEINLKQTQSKSDVYQRLETLLKQVRTAVKIRSQISLLKKFLHNYSTYATSNNRGVKENIN